jgi:hypothetical protein
VRQVGAEWRKCCGGEETRKHRVRTTDLVISITLNQSRMVCEKRNGNCSPLLELLRPRQRSASLSASKVAPCRHGQKASEGSGMQTRNGDLIIADQVGSTRHTRHLRTEELKSESRLRANDLTLLNILWAPEGRRSNLTISIPKRASSDPQACGAAGPGRINGWEVEEGQESIGGYQKILSCCLDLLVIHNSNFTEQSYLARCITGIAHSGPMSRSLQDLCCVVLLLCIEPSGSTFSISRIILAVVV